MTLDELPTPALMLDVSRLRRNLARMAERMARAGVRLRPHLKTAKSAAVARLATEGQFGGITVSTLREAAYFAEHGVRDILYAVGMVPSKMAEARRLIEGGVRLSVIVDDADTARALGRAAADWRAPLAVLVEIDSGQHRAGVAPGGEALLAVARAVHEAPGLTLEGVLTHAGHAYHADGPEALAAIAEAERAAVVQAAERLRSAGLPCPVVSAGSTPTATHARSLEGVAEMRPGVYMFGDLDQAGLGSCAVEDIAVSVLASVIGRRNDRLLVDAGALALSKDLLANEFYADAGYGWVCDPLRLDRIGDLRVASVDQEHGYVCGEGPLPDDTPAIGQRVRILPNHACLTAAAYDRYHVIDGDADPASVIDVWDRVNGW